MPAMLILRYEMLSYLPHKTIIKKIISQLSMSTQGQKIA
jgi:hypothetical protein